MGVVISTLSIMHDKIMVWSVFIKFDVCNVHHAVSPGSDDGRRSGSRPLKRKLTVCSHCRSKSEGMIKRPKSMQDGFETSRKYGVLVNREMDKEKQKRKEKK